MKFQDQPEQVAARLKEEARKKHMARVDANGWSFVYNNQCFLGSLGGFHGFSAMLQPEGRGSTGKDWEYLGQVMRHIGMPGIEYKEKFRFYTDIATAEPNSVLKWLWDEKGKA